MKETNNIYEKEPLLNNQQIDNNNIQVLKNIEKEEILYLKPELPKRQRNLVFILYLISNILISMDHWPIPASVNELQHITSYDQSIGLFGSLVYFWSI